MVHACLNSPAQRTPQSKRESRPVRGNLMDRFDGVADSDPRRAPHPSYVPPRGPLASDETGSCLEAGAAPRPREALGRQDARPFGGAPTPALLGSSPWPANGVPANGAPHGLPTH